MAKKTASVVGLDIGRSSLRLVEYIPELNQVFSVAVESLDPERWFDDAYLGDRIAAFMTDNVRNSKADLFVSLPGEYAAIMQVQVPDIEGNIADAVQWEMEQYLDRPLDEYVLDFQDLGSDKSESAKCYVAVAYRKIEVERFRALITGIGLRLQSIEADVLAVHRLFEMNYPERFSEKSFLIKADYTGVHCIKSQHGQFLGCLLVPVPTGIQDSSDDVKKELAGKIKEGLERQSEAWGGTVDFILLCGELAGDSVLGNYLQEHLFSEIVLIDPWTQVGFALPPDKSDLPLQLGSQCVAAAALALGRGLMRINLLEGIAPASRRALELAPPSANHKVLLALAAAAVFTIGATVIWKFNPFTREGIPPGLVSASPSESSAAPSPESATAQSSPSPVAEPKPDPAPPASPVHGSHSGQKIDAENVRDLVRKIDRERENTPIPLSYRDLVPSERIAYQYQASSRFLEDLKSITPSQIGFANFIFSMPGEFYVRGLSYDAEGLQQFRQGLASMVGASVKPGIEKTAGTKGQTKEFSFYGKLDYPVGKQAGGNRIVEKSKLAEELKRLNSVAASLGINLKPMKLESSSSEGEYRQLIYHTEALCDYRQFQQLLAQLQTNNSNVGLTKFALRTRNGESMVASMNLLVYVNPSL